MNSSNNQISSIQAASYIAHLAHTEGNVYSHLKIQKLLYYSQGWFLAFYNESLIDGELQAWVRGPVSREVYDYFNKTKYATSEITEKDIDLYLIEAISDLHKFHFKSVIDSYGHHSGPKLEMMTHNETPWLKARGNCKPYERCDTVITNESMKEFFSSFVRP